MTMLVTPPDSEVAWRECEAGVVRAMSAVNHATVQLVNVVVELLARNGWWGWGIKSPVHWLTWKANISSKRAVGIVQIAERRDEVPECWALFQEGRITEDAMVRIARRVPASHDAEVARTVTTRTISQLTRTLSCLPPIERLEHTPVLQPERYFRRYTDVHGWQRGEYHLPPEESAGWDVALVAARDAEFRERTDLPPDAEVGPQARKVTWVDAFVRVGKAATDSLDTTLHRTGRAGARHQIVLHHHVDHEGRMGPGRLHLGGFVKDQVARYLACDAEVIVMAYRDGKLLGINPSERTPNRRLRRYLEQRDGGCAYPLCIQKRWLHAHHLWHWEDGGPTEAWNLVCFCPLHHRGLHAGDFTAEGNPEDGTLVFKDQRGRPIEPPELGADPLPPPPADRLTYVPPLGERMAARDVIWN